MPFSACQEAADEKPKEVQPSGGGGAHGSGGGGDVMVGAQNSERAAAPATGAAKEASGVETRYARGMERMKKKDYDGAYVELGEIVTQAGNTPMGSEAARQLQSIQAQLLALPPAPAREVMTQPKKFAEQAISVRGQFLSGGSMGQASQYFWLTAEGGRLQCRYHRLHPDAKRAISQIREGTTLLIRGKMRATGATDPYLEVLLFRIE